ncbi:hypothetical protein [Lysobacter sp. CA199]|uniref:hypothetical protein n=1 Tax=Lysobacter sp. CA199 TaxID=3455608 RepID=UPI003F8D87CB
MGCCNEPVTTLTGLPADPSQHVNYERGMVLGVDDFKQEFAYLSGRDQWLAREALGYGTLSGLRARWEESGSDGPRLHVSAGTALTPGGRLICVGADQCAILNRWLAKPDNAALVARMLDPGLPPNAPPTVTSGAVSLYLTLCYADCQTRPVPIPGEPCRSEDELMKPSRVADDFRLELRQHAPVQVEEDALRDFVRWLRANVSILDTSPPLTADPSGWLAALSSAVQPWLDAQTLSPPMSPPASQQTLGDYLFDLGSPRLQLAREHQCEFLRTAFGFWISELRPMWMAMRCHRAQFPDTDCLLLGRVELQIVWSGGSPSGLWQVDGSPAGVLIDESARPYLAHLRLLQEWTLCGCDCAGTGADAGFGGSMAEMFAGPGPAEPLPPSASPVEFVDADAALGDGARVLIALGGGKLAIALPASTAANAGRQVVFKNADATSLTLLADVPNGDVIDGVAELAVKKKKAVTLVADGVGQWHSIASI